MRSMILFAVALGLSVSVAAQPPPSPGTQISALKLALDRGALLYLYDEAAWHGTDDLVANHAALMPLVGGYVVSGDQSDTELAFYDKAMSKILYRARYSFEKLISSGPPPSGREEFTPIERRLVTARTVARQTFSNVKAATCSRAAPNIAMLAPSRRRARCAST